MDAKTYGIMKKIFPIAFALSGGVGQLILGILIHLLGAPIVGFVVGAILGITIILLPLAPIVGSVIGLYGTAGAIIGILVFAKVIKEPEAEVAEEAKDDAPTDAE